MPANTITMFFVAAYQTWGYIHYLQRGGCVFTRVRLLFLVGSSAGLHKNY